MPVVPRRARFGPFWAISREPEFFLTCGFRRMLDNHPLLLHTKKYPDKSVDTHNFFELVVLVVPVVVVVLVAVVLAVVVLFHNESMHKKSKNIFLENFEGKIFF